MDRILTEDETREREKNWWAVPLSPPDQFMLICCKACGCVVRNWPEAILAHVGSCVG
jgi:hypothetical protein